MSVKSSGRLKELIQGMQNLSQKKEYKIGELFCDEFMKSCSEFSSFRDLFAVIGITQAEEFECLSIEQRDKLVSENTKFSSWDEMFNASVHAYLKRQLKL